MPIAETAIASAASEPKTVLFNERLLCIPSFQAAGRNGVAYVHALALKSNALLIDVEAEQGFFKPESWRLSDYDKIHAISIVSKRSF